MPSTYMSMFIAFAWYRRVKRKVRVAPEFPGNSPYLKYCLAFMGIFLKTVWACAIF